MRAHCWIRRCIGSCLHTAFNANASWGLTRCFYLLHFPHFRTDQRINHNIVPRLQKDRFETRWRGCNQTGRPKGIRQSAVISFLLLHFTPLVPSISFSFSLSESALISSRLCCCRLAFFLPELMVFHLMASCNVIFEGLQNPWLFQEDRVKMF